LVNPEQVKNWQTEGNQPNIKGSALTFLYDNSAFKGVSNNTGNAMVGGKLGTPSFVWIKSIFPATGSAYQVVTIFGTDHNDRLKFAKELKKLEAILVYGQISSDNQSTLPRPKSR
jgi:CRISPR-associated protein Cmr6